ncbi:MAG: hypothetical protein KIT79_03430 [Deltaproteobacteria bacterium]|nr:hypothetical protein [Deltaproteobacteria bacterium]
MRDTSASAGSGFWDRFVRPPPPDQSSRTWHISPAIDVIAYHFSWALLLVPLVMLAGNNQHRDYAIVFVMVLGVNFAHRHYGFPYAYLDGDVFRLHRVKLLWFPLAAGALFLLTPWFTDGSFLDIGKTNGRLVIAGMVLFSVLWNFWHTYMQKFGIMRIYMAKDEAPPERKTPPWVDKLFLFCWFPLYFAWVGPRYKNLIYQNAPSMRRAIRPVIQFLETNQALMMTPGVILAAAGVGLWFWHEWRAHRLRNPARMSMGLAMLLLSTSLFWINPVKVYISFAFSHAVEYMVFVWAFQRRRYHEPARPEAAPSLMARLVARPVLFYGSITFVLLIIPAIEYGWGAWFTPPVPRVTIAGVSGSNWFLMYAVYQSMVHFYMDGFLWKIRRPEVIANL